MKALVLLAATVAMTIYGQEAKVAPSTATPALAATPPERGLSEAEVLRIRLSMARVQILQDRYKLSDYQKEVQPLLEEQESIVTQACLSVGIPADKVKTECSLSTGVDNEGKPLTAPDGKPVPARVWWSKPVEQKK